jgi:predicted O-methyltransferase YrrM
MNDSIKRDLLQYADLHSSPEPPLLADLRRETHLKVLYPQMLSPILQGRFLAFLSQLFRPRRILEIGTFTGYSCLCLSEGLPPEGRIITIEVNPEREKMIRKWVQKAGKVDQIDLRIGPAIELIEEAEGPFDLVFIDADKANYSQYYQQVMPKLREGGLILADNTLWHGKVLNPVFKDKETKGIRAFNELVQNDPRAENVLLPSWDGIMMIRKIPPPSL